MKFQFSLSLGASLCLAATSIFQTPCFGYDGEGEPRRIIVRAPSSARVTSIPAGASQQVTRGDTLCKIECMKMVSSVTAPENARVERIFVGVNQVVESGTPLLVLLAQPKTEAD